MVRMYRFATILGIVIIVGGGVLPAQPAQSHAESSTPAPLTQRPAGPELLAVTPRAYLPLVLKNSAPAATVTFPHTGVISFCGISNFAWTIGNALARGGQPSGTAWQCLKGKGFTTIIRQNPESGNGVTTSAEQTAVQNAGMQYIGSYMISDDTAYSPTMLQAMMQDVVTRLKRGERILVHDSAGRGRMGFWEATFMLWDGWTSADAINRYDAFGWKINGGPGYECPRNGVDPTAFNGSNGQYQAIQAIAQALGQPAYNPSPDTYGDSWAGCAWPAYMSGWNYNAMQWPAGKGGRWSITGIILP